MSEPYLVTDAVRDDLEYMTPVGDTLFFVTEKPPGPLWTTDGTAAGTVAVRGLAGSVVNPTPFGEVLAFIHDHAMWISDGTESGTRLFAPVFPGYDDVRARSPQVLAREGTLFMVGRGPDWIHGLYGLWRSDGTAAGTFSVSPMPTVGTSDPTGDDLELPVTGTVGDTVFFSGCEPDRGCGLWAVTISSPSTTTTTSSSTSTSTSTTTSTTLTCPFGTAGLCDDDDPCTADTCEGGRCHHQLSPGLDGVLCRLRHQAPPSLSDETPCLKAHGGETAAFMEPQRNRTSRHRACGGKHGRKRLPLA